MYRKKYKYGTSKIIKLKNGITYKVRYLDKKRTLAHSKLLWMKNKYGKYAKTTRDGLKHYWR